MTSATYAHDHISRFTDESDQQRALIEMHGLYCLSRPSKLILRDITAQPLLTYFPVRISPATAKFKSPPPSASGGPALTPLESMMSADYECNFALEQQQQSQGSNLGNTNNSLSVSSINTVPSVSTSGSGSSFGSSASIPSLSASTTASSVASSLRLSDSSQSASLDAISLLIAQSNLSPDPKSASNGSSAPSITAPLVQDEQQSRFSLGTEESWKHQAQARAILGNLMGPNGEQLTSTDPYNTTVGISYFVINCL